MLSLTLLPVILAKETIASLESCHHNHLVSSLTSNHFSVLQQYLWREVKSRCSFVVYEQFGFILSTKVEKEGKKITENKRLQPLPAFLLFPWRVDCFPPATPCSVRFFPVSIVCSPRPPLHHSPVPPSLVTWPWLLPSLNDTFTAILLLLTICLTLPYLTLPPYTLTLPYLTWPYLTLSYLSSPTP